jgi:hypothetical protein
MKAPKKNNYVPNSGMIPTKEESKTLRDYCKLKDWRDVGAELERIQQIENYANANYGMMRDLHAQFLNDIDHMYSEVYQSGDFFSPASEMLINYCKADIQRADSVRKYNELMNPDIDLNYYKTYDRLAMIYFRRDDIDSAIAVCNDGIALGYKDAQDRLEKILKNKKVRVAPHGK